MTTFKETLLNSTTTTLPQDIQDNGRPIKLSLENSGGLEYPNSSTTMLMVVLLAKLLKYTLEPTSYYSQTKYLSASGNP
jgi:hypothetical protein